MIYLFGLFCSYIYWGINHEDEESPDAVRLKHLLLGWFNHEMPSDSAVITITIMWPFIFGVAIGMSIIMGIGWCMLWALKKIFKFLKINVAYSKLMNLKINLKFITKPIAWIVNKLFSGVDWVISKTFK